MGTNFYFFTNDESIVKKYACNEYTLTDTPEFGYEIHIAKTSYGWLPLFQYRETMPSVKAMKTAYDTDKLKIIDEYGQEYTWTEFDERVLKFNGGVKGAIEVEKLGDEELPISHFEFADGLYSYSYLKDEEGYEFLKGDFS